MRRTAKSIEVVVTGLDRVDHALRKAAVAMYRFQFYLTVAQLGGKRECHVQDV